MPPPSLKRTPLPPDHPATGATARAGMISKRCTGPDDNRGSPERYLPVFPVGAGAGTPRTDATSVPIGEPRPVHASHPTVAE